MKKKDLILIGGVLALAIVSLLILQLWPKSAQRIRITVDGKDAQVYSLNETRTIRIERDDKLNVIQIQDGQARMIEANCPDGLCLRQHLSKGHLIVCLPNRVVIELIDDPPEVDAHAQ